LGFIRLKIFEQKTLRRTKKTVTWAKIQRRKITFDGIVLGLRADHLERAPDTKGLVISKKVLFESEIFFHVHD